MTADRRPQTADRRPQTADRRPTFCALFNLYNQHLTKDVGLLSWGMAKYHNYDAFIATFNVDDYTNLKYLPGLRMEFVQKRTGNFIYDSTFWLMKNAKRIDVLFIFHTILRSFLSAFVYKLFNPSGKIYVKLDGCPLKKNRTRWKLPLSEWVMKHADCVSTELEENVEIVAQEWGRKIVYVPNPSKLNELQPFRPFSERNNTIFYSGRVEHEKGSHTLLEAFAKIADQIPNWTLKLAGPIPEQDIVDKFKAEHPNLRDRVIFTGNITDRQKLVELYRDAKIFVFPSRHESFGIALTEAMLQGAFAVTTDIPASRSLTANFRYGLGSPVDDIDALAQNLLYACTHEPETESLALEGMNATRKRCDLKRACDTIAEGLK